MPRLSYAEIPENLIDGLALVDTEGRFMESNAAFREIVTRHADLVYASALRQARSPELARDIAQTVFSDLVRKAPALAQSLPDTASLVGWLYRSTRFEAHTQMRDERRRQAVSRGFGPFAGGVCPAYRRASAIEGTADGRLGRDSRRRAGRRQSLSRHGMAKCRGD